MDNWLWSSTETISTEKIVKKLQFTGEPVTELSAHLWQDKKSLMDELSVGFSFPKYFGRNWDAVDEYILMVCSEGRLIIIRDIGEESVADVGRLVDCVGGMWRQETKNHPKGKVCVVLEGWKSPQLVAEWPNGTSYEYEVETLK